MGKGGVSLDVANRVQLAAHHWRPRLVANGIDVNDFEDTVAGTADWSQWGPRWRATGAVHEGLAEEAEQRGRVRSATEAYQRAAWCYHFGKFLWFEDLQLHAWLRDQSVRLYRKALPHLDPPGERIEFPFEGATIPAILRQPTGAQRPPLVLLIPGLDSSKEELFSIEAVFLNRGMATLALDGPGQSENSVRFAIRPDWEAVITPVLDYLGAHDVGVDLARVGLMGISMGAIYGPRAAAHEKRLRALVVLAGPYNLAECWDGLNPLTRGGIAFYTKSSSESEARRRVEAFHLEGILPQVEQPVLVIHGGRDGLFPVSQAERIVREAPHGTLALFPEGNHVCNNIPYKYRPLMADWLREHLLS